LVFLKQVIVLEEPSPEALNPLLSGAGILAKEFSYSRLNSLGLHKQIYMIKIVKNCSFDE
jgi:hypothetical protein